MKLPGIARNTKIALTIWAISIWMLPLQAQKPLSLEDCIQFAIDNHGTVKNARLDSLIARQQVKELIGVGLPQVNGSIEYNNFLEIPTTLIPGEFFGAPPGQFIPVQFGTQHNATASLSASQLIFDGSYFVGLQASRALAELKGIDLRRTQIEAAAAVSKAYYNALISQERKKLLDVNVDRIQKLLDNTKALQAEGFAEEIDVDRIQITFTNLQVEQKKIERLIELSYNLLKFQMGMDLNQEIILTDKIEGGNSLPSLPELAESGKTFKDSRIEYRLLAQQKHLQELNLKRYKVSRLPSVAGFASLSTQALRQEFNFFDTDERWFATAVVGFKINVPIFTGLQTKSKIEQTKLSLAKIDIGIDMLEQSVDLQVKSAQTKLLNSYETLKTTQSNVSLAEKVYRVSRTKYEAGTGSNLEVIEAESSLREAQANHLTTLYEYLLAKIELAEAKGEILNQ